jgi:hypothetical protein
VKEIFKLADDNEDGMLDFAEHEQFVKYSTHAFREYGDDELTFKDI